METLLTTLFEWLQSLSNWLQSTTGMAVKDLALFIGGILTIPAVLWLGLYSGKPRHREAARLGWLLLLFAVVVIGWGLYNRDPSSG
jgi:hypothetical protein